MYMILSLQNVVTNSTRQTMFWQTQKIPIAINLSRRLYKSIRIYISNEFFSMFDEPNMRLQVRATIYTHTYTFNMLYTFDFRFRKNSCHALFSDLARPYSNNVTFKLIIERRGFFFPSRTDVVNPSIAKPHRAPEIFFFRYRSYRRSIYNTMVTRAAFYPISTIFRIAKS